MTSLQRHLVVSWVLASAVVVFFVVVKNDWRSYWLVLVIFGIIGMFERSSLERIYAVAPTPNEFFSEHPIWKRYAMGCGLILSAIAFGLLTFAQNVALALNENLWLPLALILGLLLIPLAAHQFEVYRVLSREPDA